MANTPSAGGALLPYQDQRLKGNLTVDGNVTVTGTITGTSTGDAFASPAITGTVTGAATYSTPTLTTPVISTGLSASGSAANDFSASTGTFKTSSGANTLSGAVSIADAATPSLTTAAGKTNTGFVTISGKTSGTLKVTTADATAQAVTVTAAAQTSGATTLTIPDQAGTSRNFLFDTLAQSPTNKTLDQTNIFSAYKQVPVTTYTSQATPATITGLTWTLAASGTYVFELNLPVTMTTNGGLSVAFGLTTATLTSINYQTYASTATDNATAVSTNGTTTTSGTLVFDSATAAYTHVTIKGCMVVGTGGTFAWQAAQHASAGGGDATVLLVNGYAAMTRIA